MGVEKKQSKKIQNRHNDVKNIGECWDSNPYPALQNPVVYCAIVGENTLKKNDPTVLKNNFSYIAKYVAKNNEIYELMKNSVSTF